MSCFTSSHHIFEDESQRGLGVDNVVQRDDVGVFQLLEQRGLSDCGEGGALLLLQTDLLQRHHLVCQAEAEGS